MTNREPDAWPTGIGAITLFVEDVPARTSLGLVGRHTLGAEHADRSCLELVVRARQQI